MSEDPREPKAPEGEPLRFSGLGVSPGLAEGRAHVLDRRRVAIPHYHVPQRRRGEELERFDRALQETEAQFEELQRRTEEQALPQLELLLSAHSMILRDPMLEAATRRRVLDEGKNAEWALKTTIRELRAQFDQMEQQYFKERSADVDYVGERVLRNLVGVAPGVLEHVDEDAVIVAHELSPADTLSLARCKARGFVTQSGGPTSHTAILAKAMGVPCVLSVPGILDAVGNGDAIILDGRGGEVVVRPDPSLIADFHEQKARRAAEQEALLRIRDLASETADGVRVHLFGNLEVSPEVKDLLLRGAEGVGLYRTEFMALERPDVQDAEGHYRAYAEVVRELNGLPVTIRTLDVGADKPAPNAHREAFELNPALGMRAIRRSQRDPAAFSVQIEGILRASAEGPIGVMIPFVTGLDEVRFAKKIIAEVSERLERQGVPFDKQLRFGVMVETPASVWIADELAEEVDFFSIGTNDLIQHSLATDRTNPKVSYLYRPGHPAILRSIQRVVQAAERAQIPLTICGEIASDVAFVPILVGLGVRRLSMAAWPIPMVKRVIRRLDSARCAELAQAALACKTSEEVGLVLRTWNEALLDDA